MPTYIYLGISEEAKEARVKAQMREIHPSDERGKDRQFGIDIKDNEREKQRKRDNVAEYMTKREAELRKDLDACDAERKIGDLVFPKGEPVDVPEGHELIPLLDKQSESRRVHGRAVGATMRKVEKQSKKPPADEPAVEQEAPKRRGRPPKAAEA